MKTFENFQVISISSNRNLYTLINDSVLKKLMRKHKFTQKPTQTKLGSFLWVYVRCSVEVDHSSDVRYGYIVSSHNRVKLSSRVNKRCCSLCPFLHVPRVLKWLGFHLSGRYANLMMHVAERSQFGVWLQNTGK